MIFLTSAPHFALSGWFLTSACTALKASQFIGRDSPAKDSGPYVAEGGSEIFERNGASRALAALAAIFLATCSLLGSTVGQERAVVSRPNVILILADDLGYGDLGCYGATDLHTPNIDGLAKQGMRFSQFYANSPVCSPTRAALLTGCFPDRVGVPGVIRTHCDNSWGFLSPEATLLPELLKRAGYQTAMVGKWHLGLDVPNIPTRRGFDLFWGFIGDMMDDYWNHRRHGINYMREGEREIDPPGHATSVFTEFACRFLEEHAREPFFLYLAYNAPHSPIQPPEDALLRYRQRFPKVSERRAKLAALVEDLDRAVGRVLETLYRLGLAERTFVFFTSDNGGQEAFGSDNGPLAGEKGQMLEGGIRVPALAIWPGHIPPESQTDAVGLSMDLFPTICELAGVLPPGEIDGRSLLPILLGNSMHEETRTLFWVRMEGGKFNGRAIYAVRKGPWKLLQNMPEEPFKLYNLQDDPGETKDCATARPEVFSQLMSELQAHRRRCASVPWRLPDGCGPGELRRN